MIFVILLIYNGIVLSETATNFSDSLNNTSIFSSEEELGYLVDKNTKIYNNIQSFVREIRTPRLNQFDKEKTRLIERAFFSAYKKCHLTQETNGEPSKNKLNEKICIIKYLEKLETIPDEDMRYLNNSNVIPNMEVDEMEIRNHSQENPYNDDDSYTPTNKISKKLDYEPHDHNNDDNDDNNEDFENLQEQNNEDQTEDQNSTAILVKSNDDKDPLYMNLIIENDKDYPINSSDVLSELLKIVLYVSDSPSKIILKEEEMKEHDLCD